VITDMAYLVEKEFGLGERITVDNFHLVAMDDKARWSVGKFGGWKSFFFGGEGLVVNIEGPGRVYLQTRTIMDLVSAIARFLEK